MLGRDALCHILAVAFGCLVVVPTVFIFADRSLPFEYRMPYAKSAVSRPGEDATVVFRVSEILRSCDGVFKRQFVDSKGEVFPLGTFPTVYREALAGGEVKTFPKTFRIPAKAAEGPGFYESRTKFACNWFQWLYPIEPAPIRIPIFLLPAQKPDRGGEDPAPAR